MSDTNGNGSWGMALAQLQIAQAQAASESMPTARQTFNPRPAGVIQPGSATEAVLQFLQATPDRSYWHHAIVAGTGKTPKAVDWALLYLRALGHIEALADERNRRYLRYRVMPLQEG